MDNILPSNVKKHIITNPIESYYDSNSSHWISIGLKVIKNNNGEEKYKLVFNYDPIMSSQRAIKNLQRSLGENVNIIDEIHILNIPENDKLDKDSIYIGILDYYIKKNNKIINIRKIVYYGNYLNTIKKDDNTIIKFKNNKNLFSYKLGKLYKLISDTNKKLNIINNNQNNFSKQNINNNNISLKYNYNIPSKFIIDVRKKLNEDLKNRRRELLNKRMQNANNPSIYEERIIIMNVDNTVISEYIVKLYNDNKKKNIKLMDLEKNLLIYSDNLIDYTYNINNNNNNNNYPNGTRLVDDNISIIKLKECENPYEIKSSKIIYYFADIKYNFSNKKIINKYIYLGHFIKKEGNSFHFENIIINLKSEKLKKFVFYKLIEI